ncbi:hypothetical protein Pan44_28110 [Caulifigura coniformis]|uniref:Uncharacterized protein n=1 Tax=Caulifigura coniformis TaxID=2527983 RepID=A0A517SF58_9PLAN|nr:hypothetical protein [Caulifigura coniformis]QDT54774.1 hypothetical protein Pan44_28110 [Caulifigura coniformis]
MPDLIQLGISGDSTELREALAESRQDLQETESAFGAFSNAIMGSMRLASDAAIGSLQAIGSAFHEIAVGALHELGSMALHGVIDFGSAVIDTARDVVTSLERMQRAISLAAVVVPQLKLISLGLTVVTASTVAYANANDELTESLWKSILPTEQSSKAWVEYGEASGKASLALADLGGKLADVSVAFVTQAAKVSGLTAVMNVLDETLAQDVKSWAKWITEGTETFQNFTDTAFDFVAGGEAASASLREMAAESEKLIAKQQEQAKWFGQLGQIQREAAAHGERAAELQRIASLGTVEAVEAEVRALKEKASAAVFAGQATAESLRLTADLFTALENQKVSIAAGDQKSALQFELDTTKAINAAREEQLRLGQSAADHIARIKDQIELMTGEATKGDIALREMLRGGYTMEQAEEVRRLTDQLNELRETAQVKPDKAGGVTKSEPSPMKAAMFGSSESASIMLRGVTGGAGGKSDKVQEMQLDVLQQLLVATKGKNPMMLKPLNL